MGWKSSAVALWVILSVLSAPGIADADLIGDEIFVSNSWNYMAPESATIGDGIEFTWHADGNTTFDLYFDFDQTTLTITAPFLEPEAGYNWGIDDNAATFTGFDIPITGLSLASVNNMWDGFVTNFSFTSDSMTFDINGLSAGFGAEAIFDINPASAPVPEPATMLLFGSGLIALAGMGRRKFKSQSTQDGIHRSSSA